MGLKNMGFLVRALRQLIATEGRENHPGGEDSPGFLGGTGGRKLNDSWLGMLH